MKEKLAAMSPDERRKLWVLLGLFGVLGLAGAVVFKQSSGSAPTTKVAATPAGGSGVPGAIPTSGGTPGTGSPSGVPPLSAGGPPTAVLASTNVPSGQTSPGANSRLIAYRPDPFTPFYKPPTPAPPAPPVPTPIPPPLPLPPLQSSLAPLILPGTSGGSPTSGTLIGLPPVRIANAQGGNPRVIQPPALNREGDTSTVERAAGRRVSGIIISDNGPVSALLEIGEGEDAVTRVVQPGDPAVNGIEVLRIERVTPNGETAATYRMFIRENGQERFVDLRAAPAQTQGGPGGLSGAGGPGGFPGGRGGFPGGGRGGRGGFPGAVPPNFGGFQAPQ